MTYYGCAENVAIAKEIFGQALQTLNSLAEVRSPEFGALFANIAEVLSDEPLETEFDHTGMFIGLLDILTWHAGNDRFFISDENDALDYDCQKGLDALSSRLRPAVVEWLHDTAASGRPGVCYAVAYMSVPYRRELSLTVLQLVQQPYLVCHLDFIAQCIHFLENRKGAVDVVLLLWQRAPAEKLALAFAAVVNADAERLPIELLAFMLELSSRSAAAGRALLPAMIHLVLAQRDEQRLHEIEGAFSRVVEVPTDNVTLMRLEDWVVPIFRDSLPHQNFRTFFRSLFEILWSALKELWLVPEPCMQHSLAMLVEAVFPWGFIGTDFVWEWVVQAVTQTPMPGHALAIRHCLSEMVQSPSETVWQLLHGVTPCSSWILLKESEWIHTLRVIVSAVPQLALSCNPEALMIVIQRSPEVLPDVTAVLARFVSAVRLPQVAVQVLQGVVVALRRFKADQPLVPWDDIEAWVRDTYDGFAALAKAVAELLGDCRLVVDALVQVGIGRQYCLGFLEPAMGEAHSLRWVQAIASRVLCFNPDAKQQPWGRAWDE
jgi:hypothetical protein